MTERAVLTAVFLAGTMLSTACGRGFEYEGGGPIDTGPPVEVEECGSDLDLEAGINISGTAVSVVDNSPITVKDGQETLCVAAIDPTGAVVGGSPETIAASKLCADGTYTIAGIPEIPTIGIMVEIQDCEGSESTVMRTVTGIASSDFDGFAAGDTLEGVEAVTLPNDTLAQFQTDLDYADDLGTDGFFAGFVLDSSNEPVDGAVVTCGACQDLPTYYRDSDPSDGLFASGATLNTETQSSGGSMFIVPKGLINTYTCDDGGVHSWESKLFGSLPAYGVFIRFIAD